MPAIHISCPRISREVKAKVVAGVTRAFAEATGFEPEILTVHIAEFPHDNVGVGGRLLSDAYPELRDRAFYYDLTDRPPNDAAVADGGDSRDHSARPSATDAGRQRQARSSALATRHAPANGGPPRMRATNSAYESFRDSCDT